MGVGREGSSPGSETNVLWGLGQWVSLWVSTYRQCVPLVQSRLRNTTNPPSHGVSSTGGNLFKTRKDGRNECNRKDGRNDARALSGTSSCETALSCSTCYTGCVCVGGGWGANPEIRPGPGKSPQFSSYAYMSSTLGLALPLLFPWTSLVPNSPAFVPLETPQPFPHTIK